MRNRDIKLGELDVLISKPDKSDLDVSVPRTMGMDPRLIRDLVSDHIAALAKINSGLPNSDRIDGILSTLRHEYNALFDRRLIELLSSPASQVKAAVLELRRRLLKAEDISYDAIDSLMRDICDEYQCSPKSLHDLFVQTFQMTPDDWVRSDEKR